LGCKNYSIGLKYALCYFLESSMPKLSEIIDAFNQGFSYLNANNKRNTRYYEILFSKFSNHKLTAAIEDVATELKTNLEGLKSEHGDAPFEENAQQFSQLIAKALKKVQVKRFVHGNLKTINRDESVSTRNKSVLERAIQPKKASYFEKMLAQGLKQVVSNHTELTSQFDNTINAIEGSSQRATTVFHESRTVANGRAQHYEDYPTSMKENYYDKAIREEYASDTISLIKS
jgi:hypothetical protein